MSKIAGYYYQFPTYSWDVNVIAHEIGHNLGSEHTHWCGWVGGALDDCYQTEGGCPPGPTPVNGGTIMSYCHLTSTGINFLNGFGLQPGNRIRNVVNNSSDCLQLDDFLYFQNYDLYTQFKDKYYAGKEIYAGRNVTQTIPVGNFNIMFSNNLHSDVAFYAGHSVILSDGFYVQEGAKFHALIDPNLDCFDDNEKIENRKVLTSNSRVLDYSLSIIPNPFSSSTTITITLPEADNVNLAVFDMLGRKIYEFANSTFLSAGEHRFTLESQNLESGMFYVNFATKNNYISKPLILVK